MLLSVTFTAKLKLVFVLTFENAFSLSFHLKTNKKSISFSKKMVLGISKIDLRLRDRHVFMWESVKVSNLFSTITLKQLSWKTKTFFEKTEVPFFSWNHFHSKLLCQKPMFRQIEWQLQNGPITKSWVLPVTTSFLWKICSSFITS